MNQSTFPTKYFYYFLENFIGNHTSIFLFKKVKILKPYKVVRIVAISILLKKLGFFIFLRKRSFWKHKRFVRERRVNRRRWLHNKYCLAVRKDEGTSLIQ
jgi:hypothetical protein